MGYTQHRTDDTFQAALACARGTYQRALIYGDESWSGSTLRGSARTWGARYHASRMALLARLDEAGIPMKWETGPNGKRVLVLG